MDTDYGVNYHYIRIVFERYGWEITTTALNQTIFECSYGGGTPLNVDILISEISDVTEYDVVTIMPGESHENLRTNENALNLIQEAVAENLIVTAWCRAVRVLAAADVIDGKNVTGHVDYQAEYEAAGATFFESVPPITDENIITSVRSNYYREETCEAIAMAVGYYDMDPPELFDVSITPSLTTKDIDTIVSADFNEGALIYMVNCEVFKLNETGGRISEDELCHFKLNRTETQGSFKGVIRGFDVGNYTIDIESWDCFMNYGKSIDAIMLVVVEQLPTSTTSTTTTTTAMETTNTTTTTQEGSIQWFIPGVIFGSAILVVGVIVVALKRR